MLDTSNKYNMPKTAQSLPRKIQSNFVTNLKTANNSNLSYQMNNPGGVSLNTN